MKRIPLTKGEFALVDDADFEYLNQWKWHCDAQGYARRSCGVRKVHMHRDVNKTPDGFLTDHINRNKLDNRRENLRTVLKIENQRNHKILKTNTSGYNGISWNKATKKWEVYLWLKNRKIKIGYFVDIAIAAKERKLAELKYWI